VEVTGPRCRGRLPPGARTVAGRTTDRADLDVASPSARWTPVAPDRSDPAGTVTTLTIDPATLQVTGWCAQRDVSARVGRGARRSAGRAPACGCGGHAV